MPTSTYTPLANITLGSAASSVTFSSIGQGYRDLVCFVNGLGNTGNVKVAVRLNGDSASNYSWVYMEGNGSTTVSVSGTGSWMPETNSATGTTTDRFTAVLNLMDYSATDKHKTLLQRFDAAGSGTNAAVGRWANTAAVTSMQVLTTGASTFAVGTSFALYGIAS